MSKVESDMRFGEFQEEDLFWIENSKLHQSQGKGIRTVEFILLGKEDHVLFVEAKTSCPNKANKDESLKKIEKFESYYSEITEKFVDSLQMFLTTVLHRNNRLDDMGIRIKEKKDYTGTNFCFVLVIKKAENEEWLAGPKVELEARLMHMRKIWKAKIVVLSEQLAREMELIK